MILFFNLHTGRAFFTVTLRNTDNTKYLGTAFNKIG